VSDDYSFHVDTLDFAGHFHRQLHLPVPWVRRERSFTAVDQLYGVARSFNDDVGEDFDHSLGNFGSHHGGGLINAWLPRSNSIYWAIFLMALGCHTLAILYLARLDPNAVRSLVAEALARRSEKRALKRRSSH